MALVCAIMFFVVEQQAPVAQLDRVFGYEPKGRGFESLPAYQQKKSLLSTKTKVTFLNDVCLTANDDAYANDVSFGNDVGFA